MEVKKKIMQIDFHYSTTYCHVNLVMSYKM
jgi:hypothetical protein